MEGTTRWQSGLVAMAVLLPAPSAATGATDRRVIVVHVVDHAQVPPRDLGAARQEAHDVFREAGVEIEWSEKPPAAASSGSQVSAADRRYLTVMLVKIENATPSSTGCALGLAVPSRRAAYVFYNRVMDTSRTRPVDVGVVLGRVIAHEIGHLLLPLGRHSRYGIMRAELDFGFTNPNRFTDDEARTIRAALVARSADK